LLILVGIEDSDPRPFVEMRRVFLAVEAPAQLRCGVAVVFICAFVRVAFELLCTEDAPEEPL
jgi:hypothetical protein